MCYINSVNSTHNKNKEKGEKRQESKQSSRMKQIHKKSCGAVMVSTICEPQFSIGTFPLHILRHHHDHHDDHHDHHHGQRDNSALSPSQ